MLGRTIRRITELIAKKRKQSFLKSFNPDWLNSCTAIANYQVVSFSGSKQFADQLYSISSFYRNVGKPHSWVIYNDGSYKPAELAILSSIAGVTVCDVIIQADSLPEWCFKKYPTLIKVELLRQLTDFNKTVLFADSDILFYKQFKLFSQQFATGNWYVVDYRSGYFDPEFVLPEGEPPLNFGFLVLNKPSDWNFILEYLNKKIESKSLHYWSDQTAAHLLAQRESFNVMPVEFFVVDGKDSFKIGHAVNYNKIALRHFVGTVRHKMWQYSWKKVLGV